MSKPEIVDVTAQTTKAEADAISILSKHGKRVALDALMALQRAAQDALNATGYDSSKITREMCFDLDAQANVFLALLLRAANDMPAAEKLPAQESVESEAAE